MVIGDTQHLIRFSFVNVFEPKPGLDNGEPKFSVMALIKKTDVDVVKKVKDHIERAAQQGIQKGLYNKAAALAPTFRKCLRDGDEYAALVDDGSRDSFKGYMFFNASCAVNRPPAVVDRYAKPIMRADDFYSGCYGLVDVNFFPFKHGQGGVAAGLNSCMKWEDGERLDGRVAPEQAFAEFIDKSEPSEALGKTGF
jgi:hypothetical protein